MESKMTELDLMLAHNHQLRKVTHNPKAFGRRKAYELFGNDFLVVEGSPDSEKVTEAGLVVSCVMELIGSKFEKILLDKNVQQWMNKPYGKESYYIQQIDELLKGSVDLQFREYWNGFKIAHKHLKGLAIREAVIDHGIALLSDKYRIADILESAKEHTQTIQKLNLDSLRKMVRIEKEASEEFYYKEFQYFRPEYARYLVMLLAVMSKKANPNVFETPIPLGEMRIYFPIIQPKIDSALYSEFWRIEQKIPEEVTTLSDKLNIAFGIECVRNNSVIFFKVNDLPRLRILAEYLLEKIPRGDSDGSGGKPPQPPHTPDEQHMEKHTGEDVKETKIGESPADSISESQMQGTSENRLRTFLTVFEEAERDAGKRLQVQEFQARCKKVGLDQFTFDEILSKLITKGELYEPKPGYVMRP